MDIEIVRALHELHDFVNENTSQYYHTKPLVSSSSSIVLPTAVHSFDVVYGLKDLLLIGAITESPVLMTGGTDLGKTTLAKLMMNSLFGNDWHRLDFDLDFGKDAYTDISSDFFHEKGKRLSDLYSLHDWMRLPGFIADELNGAHAKVARKALHIIKEKDITLPDGRRAKIGHPLDDSGNTYQYQIATINEGKDYSGTFDMDKALRRRTTIEIPMDIFKPTPLDRLLLQRSKQTDVQFSNLENHLSMVLHIHRHLNQLNVHPVAEMFLAYLESFDYCKHSLTHEKCSVESKNGSIQHVCTQPIRIGETAATAAEPIGCLFMRLFVNEMCPNVSGITPGISTNLVAVARAFALLRAVKFVELVSGFCQGQFEHLLSYKLNRHELFRSSMQKYIGDYNIDDKQLAKLVVTKYISKLEVEQCDILAAAPFVAYSKLNISSIWILKHYQGNRFGSVSTFINEANIKFKEGLSRPEFEQMETMIKGNVSNENISELKAYCDSSNPWLWLVISPYLSKSKPLDNDHIKALYES